MSEDAESVTMINLRVLAKLRPGDRLQCCDTKFFSIDRGWLTWLTRWVRNDNRRHTIDRMEETFRKARALESCKGLLPAAKKGSQELLGTYAGDETTVSRIEHIINDNNTETAF